MAIVYQATNLINGKRYIGVTSRRLAVRADQHVVVAMGGAGTAIARAIRKYGREMIRFRALCETQIYADALAEERRLIAALRPEYNMNEGGAGGLGYKHTADSLAKMSAAKKGRPGNWTGRKHSAASLAKMSAAQKGRPGYWKGKSLPTHVVQATRARSLRPERQAAWAQYAAKGPASVAREVVCLNDGCRFESVSAAARFYEIDKGMVGSVCRKGRHKTVNGLVFRFWGDHEGGLNEVATILSSVVENRRAAGQQVGSLPKKSRSI